MPRIIVAGETDFHIRLEDLRPVSAKPGGLILNTAIELSRMKHQVCVASELGNDTLGHKIIDILKSEGIDCSAIDMRVDGITPTTLEFADSASGQVSEELRYDNFEQNSDGFDIAWPTIEKGDVMIFGGFLAINARVRPRLWQFLEYARDRKAKLVYLPGYNPSRMVQVTKVMPLIFENLEIADVVVTTSAHLKFIFDKTDSQKAYKDNLEFYVNDFYNIDDQAVEYHGHGGLHERMERRQQQSLAETLAWLIDNKLL